MRIHIFSFIPFCLILFGIDSLSVSSQCLNDQQSILIQLKNTINFNSMWSTKILSWNHSTDYCGWKAVSCSTDGHVIGLDLSDESISGGIENSSALFSLRYLRSLNLALNDFNFTQIPPAIASLTNLAYLNLSGAYFSGQIPVELSNMIRLVTLDLSNNYGAFKDRQLILKHPNLAMLVRNLKELEELHLDQVDISAQGYDWCQTISSSLPKLKVLSLSDCYLSGPIDASFAKLQSLSVIRLSGTNLSSPVPEFLANFTNLTVLELRNCQLNRQFPGKILQVPTLETLDLWNNVLLDGFLPDSIGNLRMLSRLVLTNTNCSGQIPPSIASLTQLVHLDLSFNNFSGSIPSFHKSKNLIHLDLSQNSLSGPIPSFQKSKSLTHLDLSQNSLSGPIPNTYFKGHLNLESVDLGSNAFNGSIPSSLFGLPSLYSLSLSDNNFHGLPDKFSNMMPSLLEELYLSSNRLEGPIPKSFFDLTSLQLLHLSNNLLSGTVQLEAFGGLANLAFLYLSYNNLSTETQGENSSSSLFPQLMSLDIASCNLQHFPNLKNYSSLEVLDLSNNQIGGEIPSWIWEVGGGLISLNLSHNLLDNFQQPYAISPYPTILDLHSNRLQGEIPVLPNNTASYLDFSHNQFNSSLPIGYSINNTYFFSISNNAITGKIPHSICTAIGLKVLDLSNNHLSGTIPSCLVQLTVSLGVLNLGKNNFSGNIPGTFPRDCHLDTLNLHGNQLQGKVPESLGNCTKLELLDLGKNNINDSFPCFLKKCSNLQVLSLGSNKLHGDIQCKGEAQVWSKLQIINLASNYFTGHVPRSFFFNLSAMIADEDGQQSKFNHLHYMFLLNAFSYFDEVTVVIKGKEMELVKIQNIFTVIDLSNNRFSGEIPSSIGELKELHYLNMSHNAFRGLIPASIGNLKQLESLDLSVNGLAGMIPLEIGNLTFLSVLNLSYNLLEGRIPAGPQLQTFTETSFEGNKGLCGIQVNISCVAEHGQESSSPLPSEEAEKNELLISFEVGIIVGLATVIAPLVLSRRRNKWYFEKVDRIVAAKMSQYYQRRNQERKKPTRFA